MSIAHTSTWSLLNNSGLDGRGLLVCWNPDCRCFRLLPKSRRLPFSGFLPLDVSSPAVGETSSGVVTVGVFTAEARRELWAHLSRLRLIYVLKMSPTAGDETLSGRNPENGRHRDFGRRWRHRQSGLQHTDRPRPSSPELFNKDNDQNNLFIVESILKIIIVSLNFFRKIIECFTSKPNTHGTFWNLDIKINQKINISEVNRSIELKFCILSIFMVQNTQIIKL